MRHVAEKQDSGPLTEPVFLILTSLAAEPKHGYALLQDIQQMSRNRVILSTGTLYGALRRLLDDGWIARFEQADKSREKQAYKLMAAGRRALAQELGRLKELTRIATGRLKSVEV